MLVGTLQSCGAALAGHGEGRSVSVVRAVVLNCLHARDHLLLGPRAHASRHRNTHTHGDWSPCRRARPESAIGTSQQSPHTRTSRPQSHTRSRQRHSAQCIRYQSLTRTRPATGTRTPTAMGRPPSATLVLCVGGSCAHDSRGLIGRPRSMCAPTTARAPVRPNLLRRGDAEPADREPGRTRERSQLVGLLTLQQPANERCEVGQGTRRQQDARAGAGSRRCEAHPAAAATVPAKHARVEADVRGRSPGRPAPHVGRRRLATGCRCRSAGR